MESTLCTPLCTHAVLSKAQAKAPALLSRLRLWLGSAPLRSAPGSHAAAGRRAHANKACRQLTRTSASAWPGARHSDWRCGWQAGSCTGTGKAPALPAWQACWQGAGVSCVSTATCACAASSSSVLDGAAVTSAGCTLGCARDPWVSAVAGGRSGDATATATATACGTHTWLMLWGICGTPSRMP